MTSLIVENQHIAYSSIDITPPWRVSESCIIFIHGVGADRNIWGDWMPYLSNHYPVICLDLPGHGQSQPWTSDCDLSFEFYRKVIAAVAEKENQSSLILIGESMGGTIALYAASNMQEQIRAVATCSTAHRGGTLRHVNDWRDLITQDGIVSWSLDMLEKRFFESSVSDSIRNWFHHAQCNSDPDTILAMANLLVTSNLSSELDKVLAPVLLMHPDSSPFIPLDVSVELKALLSNGRLKVIPKARHGIACSHADDCALETSHFLKTINTLA
jgi:pimeloyl-ACP methyl ester carboxylesterase